MEKGVYASSKMGASQALTRLQYLKNSIGKARK